MKTRNPAAAALALSVACTLVASAQLRVDFNSTNQEGGPHNQSGFQSYQAAHEIAADFTAARSYSAFGTTVTLKASFPDSADPRTMQMFDRPASDDVRWTGAWPDLLTDWIGVDTRTASGGNGSYDGSTGTPTRLLLRLGNLPAGTYTWRSYHHDNKDQNGNFAVKLSTDGGTTYTSIGTFEMTAGIASEDPAQTGAVNPDPRALPSTVSFPITANGAQDVVVAFVPLPVGTDIAQQFFGCNAFELFNPASPPPGPDLTPVAQPAGSYSLDFGTSSSPVQSGFAGLLGAAGANITINGVNFELREAGNNLLSANRSEVTNSNLLSDFVYNPGTQSNAGIVVRVTGLPAGDYNLESWHYDPQVPAGMMQLEKRPVGGTSAILVDQFPFSQNPATTTFTCDGSPFELVTRNDSAQNVTRWNGLRIVSTTPPGRRPHSPWVFRTLMENRTRMVVAALHQNLWISFSPGNCCIDRAWAGGMQLLGKVHDDTQRNSWINGALYHRYPNSIFEATDESALPAGWAVNSGSINFNVTQATSYINPLRDKRVNRMYGFNGSTAVTTGTYDLSHHKEVFLFFEEKDDSGTNWNILPGSGSMRVQVSEDNGATWTSQDFFSTDPTITNQFNFKQILSRSPNTRLRFTGQGGQYGNITLEGEFEGWTASNSSGPVSVEPNWLGYRTLHRDESLALRYALKLAGGTSVSVEETPEAIPQASGAPKLERRFLVSGIPANTTVSLRLTGDPAWSAFTESWAHTGTGALRSTGGVTYLDLTADGTATVTATWTP